MRTLRTTLVLVLMVVLAAGAGVVVGKLITGHTPPPTPGVKIASLSEQLQLTADQETKMRAIWELARDDARQNAEEARKFQREYDDAVTRLLTPEQQVKYKELSEQAKKKTDELEQRRKKAFDKAVADTNAILNDSQRMIYQEILRNRVGSTGAGNGND
jgi:Spy/CpxP family protein refolding chaperone